MEKLWRCGRTAAPCPASPTFRLFYTRARRPQADHFYVFDSCCFGRLGSATLVADRPQKGLLSSPGRRLARAAPVQRASRRSGDARALDPKRPAQGIWRGSAPERLRRAVPGDGGGACQSSSAAIARSFCAWLNAAAGSSGSALARFILGFISTTRGSLNTLAPSARVSMIAELAASAGM